MCYLHKLELNTVSIYYKLEPALLAPGNLSWIVSHNGFSVPIMSFQAGHARLSIGTVKRSVIRCKGLSISENSRERELGRKVLRISKTKHSKLLSSSSRIELSTPPVILCRSAPAKELTLPVFPPVLWLRC